nr:thiosulfate oxidation carrier complex protein SoxZ [Variovorax boronicumulans]
MAEPSRIRTQTSGANTVVRVLMAHEMESGQRKDAAGKLLAAWHITEVTALLNGKPVLRAQWGPGVSRNPLLRFTLRGARSGDKLSVSWTDNRGATRTDEATVA